MKNIFYVPVVVGLEDADVGAVVIGKAVIIDVVRRDDADVDAVAFDMTVRIDVVSVVNVTK
jgi:hypothetical protein